MKARAPYKILVLTTSRADFGTYASVLDAMKSHPRLAPSLAVTGMHLSPEFGETIREVAASGFPIAAQFPCLADGDDAKAVAEGMGTATLGMALALDGLDVDLLLTLGDRYEMLAAAIAAAPYNIPIAHIHGGEETEGAMDNAFRHMLTKLSHLHFCATERSAQRIRQMGESDNRIFVSGAPALDSVRKLTLLSREELAEKFDFPTDSDFVLATYHPVTLDLKATEREIAAIFAALDEIAMPTVFTAANADTAGRSLNEKIAEFASARKEMHLVDHMGPVGYFSAMSHAAVMIGNSSSGILEAASFGLAVVNVGDRQKGRERSPNVIDVSGVAESIIDAVGEARGAGFQAVCARKENVYGRGDAGPVIADTIANALDEGLSVRKTFAWIDAPNA